MRDMKDYEDLIQEFSHVNKKVRAIVNKMRKDRKSPNEVRKHLEGLRIKK